MQKVSPPPAKGKGGKAKPKGKGKANGKEAETPKGGNARLPIDVDALSPVQRSALLAALQGA